MASPAVLARRVKNKGVSGIISGIMAPPSCDPPGGHAPSHEKPFSSLSDYYVDLPDHPPCCTPTCSSEEIVTPGESLSSADLWGSEIEYFTAAATVKTSSDSDNDESYGSRKGETEETRKTALPNPMNNMLLVAYKNEDQPDFMRCLIVRERQGVKRLTPTYSMIFQAEGRLVMMAQKRISGKTTSASYDVFDMSRGNVGQRLNKKGGNFIGELVSNFNKTDYTLVTRDQEKFELGAILFERPGLVAHIKEGGQPRSFHVQLPAINSHGVPRRHQVDRYERHTHLLDQLKRRQFSEGSILLQSKSPSFENGSHKLNFSGRVTAASVKNFQVVRPRDSQRVVCQFGKIGDDRFHLDYRSPLSAIQAFALALAQFNY